MKVWSFMDSELQEYQFPQILGCNLKLLLSDFILLLDGPRLNESPAGRYGIQNKCILNDNKFQVSRKGFHHCPGLWFCPQLGGRNRVSGPIAKNCCSPDRSKSGVVSSSSATN